MSRENLAFLAAGLAFGILIGFGVYHGVATQPDPATAIASSEPGAPQGPAAPTAMGGPNAGGGAPMVAEINRLKAVLQDDATNEDALQRLGNLYQDAGIFRQAIDYYERLRVRRPNDPNLLTDLGVCYRGISDFEGALALFGSAHQIDARHWQSLFNTAVVAAFDVGEFDRAEAAIRLIEALDPPPADLDRRHLEQLRHAVEQARAGAVTGRP
jgi:tetratricopeptide (TPR) repeat protein